MEEIKNEPVLTNEGKKNQSDASLNSYNKRKMKKKYSAFSVKGDCSSSVDATSSGIQVVNNSTPEKNSCPTVTEISNTSPIPLPYKAEDNNALSDDETGAAIALIPLSDIVEVVNPKTDFCERTGDTNLTVFLYVKNINKETYSVQFFDDKVLIRFSTFDSKFLEGYANTTKDTVFQWTLKLKGEICPEECSHKLGQKNLELKLKKVSFLLWGSLSEPTASSDSNITKDVWVSAGGSSDETSSDSGVRRVRILPCTNLVNDKSSDDKESIIPPAPPAPPPFNESKKPTCLVSPATKSSIPSLGSSSYHFSGSNMESRVCEKGLSGLDNIGNTCFMNSVLQCLMNTRELREYFAGNYQEDINKENPLGMGGRLAACFANLIDLHWKGTVRSHAPSKLKQIMSLKANQFSGYAQHDAQEFMVELLDGLHEDLNRIKKKPYIADPPDLDGYPNEEAANISWKLHKSRNDSIIDDLFKGQFKSTLRCHECDKVSVKFDEFCCLSVPIPKDLKVLQVVFFWRDITKRPKKFVIRLPADSFVEDLKLQLSTKTGVAHQCIQVMETVKSKIHKVFGRGASLPQVSSSEVLMAFEVLDENMIKEPVVELCVTQRIMIPSHPTRCASCNHPSAMGAKLNRCTKCYRVGYCDTSCQRSHWPSHKSQCKLYPDPVGAPFIVALPESQATYSNLSRMVEGYARFSVDIFQPPVAQTQSVRRRRRGSTSSGESSETEDMDVDSEGSNDGKDFEMEGNGSSYSGEDRAEADWPFYQGASGGTGSSSGPSHNGDASAAANSSVRARRSSSMSSTSSGGEDIPLLSSSPSLKNQLPQRPAISATSLFTLKPTNHRSQSLPMPSGETLSDKDSEPLDLRGIQFLVMDWQTNEKRPVYCLVQNKEIDCEVEEFDSTKRSKHTTLEACIDLFTKPENLSEEDSWRCPQCKKPVEATKQMSMWRLPTVLIIQLKRFSFKYVLYSDKIDKFVQYPIENLNLAPFMSKEATDGPAVYDLYGVINHMGRLLGGHYTSYCRTISPDDTQKSEIDWRVCDDSRVNFVNESRVVHDQAYLLLYRRRGVSFSIPRPMSSPEKEDESLEESPLTDAATPMSLSNGSVSDPPSTLQEELD